MEVEVRLQSSTYDWDPFPHSADMPCQVPTTTSTRSLRGSAALFCARGATLRVSACGRSQAGPRSCKTRYRKVSDAPRIGSTAPFVAHPQFWPVLDSCWSSFKQFWGNFKQLLAKFGPQKLPRNTGFHVLGVTKAMVNRNYGSSPPTNTCGSLGVCC